MDGRSRKQLVWTAAELAHLCSQGHTASDVESRYDQRRCRLSRRKVYQRDTSSYQTRVAQIHSSWKMGHLEQNEIKIGLYQTFRRNWRHRYSKTTVSTWSSLVPFLLTPAKLGRASFSSEVSTFTFRHDEYDRTPDSDMTIREVAEKVSLVLSCRRRWPILGNQ